MATDTSHERTAIASGTAIVRRQRLPREVAIFSLLASSFTFSEEPYQWIDVGLVRGNLDGIGVHFPKERVATLLNLGEHGFMLFSNAVT